jgi:hypothetical protein
MWFLIRAAFWLSVVFALLPWPEDSGVRPSAPAAIWSRSRDAIGAALGKVQAASAKVCGESPLACLETAAGLAQVVAAKRPESADAASRPQSPAAETVPTRATDLKTRPDAQHKAPPRPVKAGDGEPQPH